MPTEVAPQGLVASRCCPPMRYAWRSSHAWANVHIPKTSLAESAANFSNSFRKAAESAWNPDVLHVGQKSFCDDA